MGVDEATSASEDTGAGFEAFYRRVWSDAAGWGAALCGDVHSGEEAAQEAFVRVSCRYDKLDHPEAYLRRVLVNVVRESHRSSNRRAARERRSPLYLTRRSAFPREELADPEIDVALKALPDRQRAVIVLRYWADWDTAQIADALGCRPSTVRSAAKRGIDRLRRELEGMQ